MIKSHRVSTICGLLVFIASVFVTTSSQVASANWLKVSSTHTKTAPYYACPQQKNRFACQAIVDPPITTRTRGPVKAGALTVGPESEASPALSGSGVDGGYSPADLRSAYGQSSSGGSGQTVAIVDAYDDPKAEADLATYRAEYGLPSCTKSNGCFRKVSQTGTDAYPPAEEQWASEISIDLDMVSAVCPNCHILLVEANNNERGNLAAAENEAAALGANEISNSFGGASLSSSYTSSYYHRGVSITVSAGDHGYGVEFPAVSSYVIAVGGTTLTKAQNSRGWSETAWSKTGSGCSLELKPTWQTDSRCEYRTDNDVAAVADPNTPVSVYDSYGSEYTGWTLFGGTSVSSPLVAGMTALANTYTRSLGANALYKEGIQNGTGVLDDVTSGSNGSCGLYLCTAGFGYDGPTGLGSPYGTIQASWAPSNTGSTWSYTWSDGGTQDVFFRNTSRGELAMTQWTPQQNGWTNYEIPGSPAGPPTTAIESDGMTKDVFYQGSNGYLWDTQWTSVQNGFTAYQLPGSPAGTPAAVMAADGSTKDVYYQGTNGYLWATVWNTTQQEWVAYQLPGSPAGSPAAVIDPNGTSQDVFYRGTDNELWMTQWTTTQQGWTAYRLGGSIAGNPAVLVTGGTIQVFYEAESGSLTDARWSASEGWTFTALPGSPSGTPSVILESNGVAEDVFYRGTDNELWMTQKANPQANWTAYDLGGSVWGNPTALQESEGSTIRVLYRGGNTGLWQAQHTSTEGWTFTEEPGSISG